MKKKLIYAIVLLIAIIMQTSVLPVISHKATGDAVAMAVLAFSILDGFAPFLAWAVVYGVAYDLASYLPVGTNVLIFLPIVYFVSFFSRRFLVEFRGVGLILSVMFIIVATFLSRGIFALEKAWEMHTFHGYWNTFGSLEFLGLKILCNAILFFFWLIFLRNIKKKFAL